MTEAEWLACDDSRPMLEHLQGKSSDRKLRLFAVACCRQVWHLLPDERSHAAVGAAESFAEGRLRSEELESYRQDAGQAFQQAITPACREAHGPRTPGCAGARAALLSAIPEALEAAATASYQSVNAMRRVSGADFMSSSRKGFSDQANLLRCIFGDHFSPVTIDPRRLPSTVLALAHAIYEERAFDRLPILADALEDAGCHDTDILAHCRGPGPHARGCWVVDLLLEKA